MNSCQTRIYAAEFSASEIAHAVQHGRLLSMEIEFNSVCNFRCVYCYADDGRKRNELTKEQLQDVMTQAKELGARKIIVLGGEPMLYPHIMEMIRFIRGLDMDIELFTNGTGITPDTAKTLFEYKVRVVLKMNSFDENVQDELSGKKGAYAQIQESFANLKQAGYPSEDRFMGVSTIICQQNIKELAKMWEWLRDQNIAPYFELITPQGGAAKNNVALEIDTKQAEEFFHTIAEIDKRKYGNSWDPRPPLVGGVCLRHQFSCSVNSEGNVQPCVGVTIPIGNVREKKLKEILGDSEVVQDLKRYRHMIKGPCASCENLNECYGCRGAAYQLTGDYLASDPMCWKNKDKKTEILYLPVEAARLVPHKPPMLLIDRLVEMKERSSVSEMTVRAGSSFVNGSGTLDEASYPEIISQALAAQEGFRKHGSRVPQPSGFQVNVKQLDVPGVARIGDMLQIRIVKTEKNGDYGLVQGEVYRGSDLIARATVNVVQTGCGSGCSGSACK